MRQLEDIGGGEFLKGCLVIYRNVSYASTTFIYQELEEDIQPEAVMKLQLEILEGEQEN